MSPVREALPIPDHFDPAMAGKAWRVPYQERGVQAEAWALAHGIAPAAEDGVRACLLLIDCQNTFCLPDFELFVAGAVEDNVRLCRFIYRNLGAITNIAATMDTHTAAQIFHALFWLDEEGAHPEPHTIITAQDVERGRWRPNPGVLAAVGLPDEAALQAFALHYVRELDRGGKYPLIVWPYHSMLGGVGHALVSSVEEACFFHAIARKGQTRFETKGGNPLTEHYSALRPEVLSGPGGSVIDRKNEAFVDELLGYDLLIVAGQAKSHCVAWTVEDLLTEIRARDPGLAAKVYLLEDCASPVVVPGVADFTPQADEAYRRFAQAGMHVVRADDPMATWPGAG